MSNPTGYAVEVLRGERLHCGFWHHPTNKIRRREDLYTGVPFVQPLNAKRFPVLVFATEEAAETAAEYFNALWGRRGDPTDWRDDVYPGEYRGRVREVSAEPTHRLSDDGFKPIPTGLFA